MVLRIRQQIRFFFELGSWAQITLYLEGLQTMQKSSGFFIQFIQVLFDMMQR